MGDPKGFITLRRATPSREAIESRVNHWREFYVPIELAELKNQGARCMDCGVPFCQGDTGCPVYNLIPEWNDLVHRGNWREASDRLHSTNNFPEFTGRLCPAPCESACVLGLIGEPVAIRTIEQAIADRGFAEGWIIPRPPARESGFRIAIVGSGPAGLAAAQQLRRKGHAVSVFEKDDRIGGLLRYGIPEFKLEKSFLDRRVAQLEAEGVVFRTRVEVGGQMKLKSIRDQFDAVLLATGAQEARDLTVPGRVLRGVHLAMDFLVQQNRRNIGDTIDPSEEISALGKRVIVIGGGDTGSDCAGTCHRQGALSVHQFELLGEPPANRATETPWPLWPMQLRCSHAHEEGCKREWNVATTSLSGESGHVRRLHAVRVAAHGETGALESVAGTEFEMEADLVLLAMGFTGIGESRFLKPTRIERTARNTVVTDGVHNTGEDGVFAAGDVRRGASLLVWAIREGRDAAQAIDQYLARNA